MEAESSTTNEPPMVLVRTAAPPPGVKPVDDASGGAYLEIPEKSGNPPDLNAGKAVLAVDVSEDGSYFFWLRAYWEGECSNSLQVRIDDRPPFVVGEDGTYHTWHWVKYPMSRLTTLPALSRGRHTLTLLNREDGVRMDQILLTTDKRFVPVGIEKARTAGHGNSVCHCRRSRR